MYARAQWVALRTFRRRVKYAGRTDAGAPTFSMASVMLAYPPGARHFYPIAECSRCAGVIELPEPVLSTADLELSRRPHLCQACARRGVDRPARPTPPHRDTAPLASWGPASDADVDRGRPEADPAAVGSSAVARAEEIRTEAEQAAAALLARAEAEADHVRAAAEAEASRIRAAAEASASDSREAALRAQEAAERSWLPPWP